LVPTAVVRKLLQSREIKSSRLGSNIAIILMENMIGFALLKTIFRGNMKSTIMKRMKGKAASVTTS
jgi:hypothetical protein